MLEVPSEFFNDEDKSFMEAGDMDDSKVETVGHTLASNTDNDRRRCHFPRQSKLWKHVSTGAPAWQCWSSF